jgi:ABC-type glycerol-3-phosphate transport system substrate-binding protein
LDRAVSRRQVLRGSLLAGGAAFLAACGASATPAPTAAPATPAATAAPATPAATAAPATPAPTAPPTAAASSAAPSPTAAASSAAASASASASAAPSSAAPSASAENYQGVSLHNFTGGYMIPWLDAGTAAWNAATGGTAVSDNVDFASKQIKQAGIIATQDSSYDMMYTTAAYGYIQKFAERLLLPVTSDPTSYGADLSDFFDNSKKQLTAGDGTLRALPLYDFPTLWGWNKALFTKIGADPENPPDNYPDLFALAPKFIAAGIIPCVQPWLATQANLFALDYFTNIWNSTGMPLLSPDRTMIGFDNDTGLAIFQLMEDGFKSGFWDPKYMNLVNEHDAYTIFGKGNTATIIESESPILTGDMALFGKNHGTRVHPGWKAGTSGSQGGPDGLGVSKFSAKIPASWSWSRYNFSAPVEKAAATTVKDSTGALVLFPVARTSVVADPDVVKAQPLQPLYQAQNKFQTDRWSSPYDLSPVFNEAVSKMIDGSYTAAQAHDACVKGSQDLIVKYLSS